MTTITVTKKHIRMGRKGDSGSCPVAMAIGEAINPGLCLHVHQKKVRIVDNGDFGLPKSATRFIKKYDIKKSLVAPFSFRLGLPLEILR